MSSLSAFKIITYNIANYDDHKQWNQRLELIAQNLAKINADIISFQEVRFNPDQSSTEKYYQNQAEQILRTLNEEYGLYYSAHIMTLPSMYYGGGGAQYPSPTTDNQTNSYWEGKTILSKPRIIETGTVYLTKTASCTDNNLRTTSYILASLNETSGEKIYIYNTHFGLDGECLKTNAEETLSYIQQHTDNHEYALLMGDMNATPDDPALQGFTDAGFVDLWPSLNPSDIGYTQPNPNPVKRIDYMWGLNPQSTKAAVSMSLFGEQPNEYNVYPSDHLGVVCEFNFETTTK